MLPKTDLLSDDIEIPLESCLLIGECSVDMYAVEIMALFYSIC